MSEPVAFRGVGGGTSPLPVFRAGGVVLPEACLAAVRVHADHFEAYIVDMTTWGLHSIVEDTPSELPGFAARVADRSSQAGLIRAVCVFDAADMVPCELVTEKPPPVGGGGPNGIVAQPVQTLVEALTLVALSSTRQTAEVSVPDAANALADELMGEPNKNVV